MTQEQITAAFAANNSTTKDLKNLIFISLNNAKGIHVTEEMKQNGEIVFDDDNDLLVLQDNNYVMNTMTNFQLRKVKVYNNYEFIETLIFALDDESLIDPKPYTGDPYPLAHNEPTNAHPDRHIFGASHDTVQPQKEFTGLAITEADEKQTLNKKVGEVVDFAPTGTYLSHRVELTEGEIGYVEDYKLVLTKAGQGEVTIKHVTVTGAEAKITTKTVTVKVTNPAAAAKEAE